MVVILAVAVVVILAEVEVQMLVDGVVLVEVNMVVIDVTAAVACHTLS